jgi:hypothetical protein
LFGEQDEGGVVVDVASGFIEDAVVTMGGVGVEGDIGEERQIRQFFFQGPQGVGNKALGVEPSPPVLGAEGGFDAGKDGDPADPTIGESVRVAEERGKRMTKMSGKTGDRGGGAGTVFHKEGGNQVGRGDGRFRKQPPDSGGTAEAAASNRDGKLGTQGNSIISPPEMKMKIKIKRPGAR